MLMKFTTCPEENGSRRGIEEVLPDPLSAKKKTFISKRGNKGVSHLKYDHIKKRLITLSSDN